MEGTQPTSGLSRELGVGREERRVGREDKEKQEGHQVAGKYKPPPPTIPPHPHPLSPFLAWEGGCNTTAPPSTACSLTAARNQATELSFGFFGPPTLCLMFSRTHDPVTTTTLYTP